MTEHTSWLHPNSQPTAVDHLGFHLPCHDDPDLWFAERPEQVEEAKQGCRGCPMRQRCLTGALTRQEPWGVWGGELLEQGRVVAQKRGRGRPRKDERAA